MDRASSWRAAFKSAMPEGKTTEELAKPDEFENERKFSVDPDCLPDDMMPPWMLVQGYLTPAYPEADEVSIRLIPARQLAFLRRKSLSKTGRRAKISAQVDYATGVAMLYDAPALTVKDRHIVRDGDGRAWAVDFFPELDEWYAESEFPTVEDMNALEYVPVWINDELTGVDEGYTRTRATEHSEAATDKFMRRAYMKGSMGIYLPSEDKTFNWKEESGWPV